MLILITGGSGNMGRRLAIALLKRGQRVRILCMRDDPGILELKRMVEEIGKEPDTEIVIGDITEPNSLTHAFQCVEVVYHLAAILFAPVNLKFKRKTTYSENIFEKINSLGTQNVAKACVNANVNHLIYVSSISVMYSLLNPYAFSKKQGEEWIRQSNLKNYTIVRPSLAYNNGGAEEFMRFVAYLKKSIWIFLPGGGKARKRPVHIDDLVTALLAIPLKAKSYGQTYLLTGSESISLIEMTHAILRHMGKEKKIISIPIWLCHVMIFGFALRTKIFRTQNPFTFQIFTGLIQDADFFDEISKIDIDFNPRSFSEGIASLKSLKNILND